MTERSPDYPIFNKLLGESAIAQTTESKSSVGMPNQEPKNDNSGFVAGGSLVVGGIAVWAVVAKLLERFGNSAIDARQQEINAKLEQQRQEVDEQKNLSKFFIDEAKRDSGTINETLDKTTKNLHEISQIFITRHLTDTKQLWDLYYEQKAELTAIKEELKIKNERLESIESFLRDIFKVLQMRERNNN